MVDLIEQRGIVLTTELSNEQIVTNILVSNQVLKPIHGHSFVRSSVNLGEYMSNPSEDSESSPKHSRYSFINPDKCWDNIK